MEGEILTESKGPSSSRSQQSEATGIEGKKGGVSKERQAEGKSESSSTIQRKPIRIVVEGTISSAVLLADGQQSVSGDKNGKIRRWRVEDGEEIGTPIDAESSVRCLATSQDGKWIAAGTESGRVTVWDTESRKELRRFAREKAVNSVDISSDGTKIAIAWDGFVNVSSLPDGKQLHGRKNCDYHTVKLSPDGLLFAIGVQSSKSSFLQVVNIQNNDNVSKIRISTRSVAWASDSKQLFALSSDGDIHCVEVSSRKTLSKWSIHSQDNPTCITLSSNNAFIAASANSSVSFWGTSTHEQIGFVIHYPHSVDSITISQNYDLLVGGSSGITLWDLHGVLSTPYIDGEVGRSLLP